MTLCFLPSSRDDLSERTLPDPPACNPIEIKASLLLCSNISVIRYRVGSTILSVSRYFHASDSHGRGSGRAHHTDTVAFEVDPTLVELPANILFRCFALQHNSVIGTDWTMHLSFPTPSGGSFNLFLCCSTRGLQVILRQVYKLTTYSCIKGIRKQRQLLDFLERFHIPGKLGIASVLNVWRSHASSVYARSRVLHRKTGTYLLCPCPGYRLLPKAKAIVHSIGNLVCIQLTMTCYSP